MGRWIILVHRYLAMTLSLLFVVWFVSGIAMIYARGMPALALGERLERMPPLDLSRVRLSPSDAAARALVGGSPERALLLTIMDRPAYRFYDPSPTTMFADTGETLEDIDQARSLAIASLFMNVSPAALHYVRLLERADQWTIAQRGAMPLHKIAVDDAAHTELYVSGQLGEVVVRTTRAGRVLAWVAAIPHWLYFTALRRNDRLWTDVVLWTSGSGAVAAMLGLVLAVTRYRVRYSGLMRWHYVSGVAFGAFALTWTFSGFLSMQPWDWASSENTNLRIQEALDGEPLDLSLFPRFDPAAWKSVLAGFPAKELEFRRLQGSPYYVQRGRGREMLISADRLQIRPEGFSVASVLERIRKGFPSARVIEVQLLSDYDAYYYDRDKLAKLPVLRVKFDDPEQTWVYVDPVMSQMVAQLTRRSRIERWLYHGLHSLDFPVWLYGRPLWGSVVIFLCSGGAVLSAVGVLIGFKRLRRSVGAAMRRLRSQP
jgi:hypothetical protein